MRKLLITVIWLALLAGLIWYLAGHADDLANMLDLSPANIGLLALLFLATQFLNGAEIMALMKNEKVSLKFWECFCLANITTAANYLPLKGGQVARAVYLRKKHDLPYADFAGLAVGGILLSLIVIFLSGAFFLVMNFFITGKFFAGLFWVFTVLFLGFLSLAFFFGMFNKKLKWQKLDSMGSGLRRILRDRALLARLVVINLLSILVMGLRFFVSFRALSFRATLLLSLLCGQIKKAVTIIGMIPSGLGISEASVGAVSGAMKEGLEVGIFAASLDRVVTIVVLILIGTYSLYYLARSEKAVGHG